MDENTLGALRLVQQRRTLELGRALASQLQSAGLVQRMNGELCLTAKGVAVLNASGQDASS